MKRRDTTLGGSGELYSKKFYNIRKVQEETWSETSSGVLKPPGGAAGGPTAPTYGLGTTGAVSHPVRTLIFPYLIKTTKISTRKLFAKLFLPKLLPIRIEFCSPRKMFFNESFRSHHFNCINLFINRISRNIMLESLTIYHLCRVIFQWSNFYCTWTIDFFDNIWSFPLRE